MSSLEDLTSNSCNFVVFRLSIPLLRMKLLHHTLLLWNLFLAEMKRKLHCNWSRSLKPLKSFLSFFWVLLLMRSFWKRTGSKSPWCFMTAAAWKSSGPPTLERKSFSLCWSKRRYISTRTSLFASTSMASGQILKMKGEPQRESWGSFLKMNGPPYRSTSLSDGWMAFGRPWKNWNASLGALWAATPM